MIRLAPILAGLIIIAQFDGSAHPVRCWVIDGVPVDARSLPGPGPF